MTMFANPLQSVPLSVPIVVPGALDHARRTLRAVTGGAPEAAAAALGKPLLILQGGRDYQVTLADAARRRGAQRPHPAGRGPDPPAGNRTSVPADRTAR